MINFKILKSKNANALALYNIMGPVILNGINFFTIPIFTRLLGTENYGRASLYITWLQVMSIIIGLQTSGSIGAAQIHLEKEESDKYCSSILFLSFCSFICISAITLILLEPVSALLNMSSAIVVLLLLNSFSSYVIGLATLRYTFNKQAHKTFVLSVAVALLGVILSWILINGIDIYENRYIGRIYGYALPNVIIGFGLFAALMLKGKTLFSKRYWEFCLPICLPIIFHSLSHIVLGQSDRIMLQYYAGEAEVGIYSLIFNFAHVLNIIWSALNNTWVPFYYDDVKAENYDAIKRKTNNYLFLYTILTIGFIYLAPEVIKLFASPDFWSGIDTVPVLAIGMYFVFLYSFPVNFQFYHKKTINIAVGTTLCAVLNIILNALLIPRYSMAGAAYATLISYIALFIFHQLIARYVIKGNYHYSFKTFSTSLAALGVSLAVYYITKDYFIVRWGIGIILGMALAARIVKNKSIF